VRQLVQGTVLLAAITRPLESVRDLVRADRREEAPVLEHAQELDLDRQRGLADFIQE
jgi:hypothetical protein